MPTYIREDMADIRVTVNGVPYGDSWATAEGGGLEADDSKTRPGGMGREVSVGGPASREDLTVTTQFTDIVANWHHKLENLIGTGNVQVGLFWLGPDRVPLGSSKSIRGILKSVSTPNVDSEGGDVGMYTLVVSCHEQSA